MAPITRLRLVCTLFISVSVFLGERNLIAQATDISGVWRGRTLGVPVDFRESRVTSSNPESVSTIFASATPPEGYELVDVWLPSPFSAQTNAFTIGVDGSVSGSVSGTAVALGKGVIEHREGGESVFGHLCVSNDVMVFLTRDPNDSQELALNVRPPDSLQTSDLAGDWNVTVFRTPSLVRKIFLNEQTQGVRTGRDDDLANPGERMVDIYLEDPWELERFAAVIGVDGSLTGPGEGTVTAKPDQTVEIQIDGTTSAAINRSKDVMVFASAEGSSQEMGVILKAPASAVVGDLAGTWRVATFNSPNRLVKTYWNGSSARSTSVHNATAVQGERLVDLYFEETSNVDRGLIQISPSGDVSGLVAGTVAVGPGGGLTINADGSAHAGYVNASKTVIVVGETDGGEQSLTVLVKLTAETPSLSEWRATPLRVSAEAGAPVRFNWIPDSGLSLQTSSSLGGSNVWTPVPSSQGAGQATVEIDPVETRFFRVAEQTGP